MRCYLADLCVHIQHFFAALNSQHLPPNLHQVKIHYWIPVRNNNVGQQDIVNPMPIDFPLHHTLVRTVTEAGIMDVYRWHTRGPIDNVTVDQGW
jgi:hypothetical protein